MISGQFPKLYLPMYRKFQSDSGGVAALEFALVLPLLITIYFGTVEAVRMTDNSRKLTLFTRTIADLSGRADNPNPTVDSMNTIFSAASAILQPFNASGAKIVINAMGVESINGVLYGGVCSSYAQNSTKRPQLTMNGTNGLPAIPATYRYDGARYILAEVTMPYTPVLGSTIYNQIFGSQGLVFSRQIVWAERTNSEIVMPTGTVCPRFS